MGDGETPDTPPSKYKPHLEEGETLAPKAFEVFDDSPDQCVHRPDPFFSLMRARTSTHSITRTNFILLFITFAARALIIIVCS